MKTNRWIFLCAALLTAATACQDEPAPAPPASTEGLSLDQEEGDDYDPLDRAAGKADGATLSNEPLSFDGACDPAETVTIAAVGDVLLHGRLQQQAYASPDGFVSLWAGIKDLLEAADITYANLEGPTAQGVNSAGRDVADPGKTFDGKVYTSYPQFNYHPSLLGDLMESGVDVVSTANNHSLDRRALGVDRTIDALEAAGLPFTGTRRRGDTTSPWYTITEVKGMRLAWIACTYGTNGLPDNHHQVLWCYQDADLLEAEVKQLAARDDVDAVLVTPHWGQEYKATPERAQIRLARRLLDAGATAILGSHPHVLQPWERYTTPDGRQTFIVYSLGNFVSGQSQLARRSTMLLYLGLSRGADGQVRVSGARYVPLHMTSRGDGTITLEAVDRASAHGDSRALTLDMFGLWNLHAAQPPVATAPHCDPAWQAPHPHDGWIGGACADPTALGCGQTFCDLDFPGGLCTQPCDRFCPDLTGRAGTFCVADPQSEAGLCVSQCQQDDDCRAGYKCQETARFNDPTTLRRACLP
jgi:hypothetical protein